jgi:glutathione S-transferase
MARERDLCDVKIKITEHFPGVSISDNDNDNDSPTTISSPAGVNSLTNRKSLRHETTLNGNREARGGRYFTIQRVNGNGANGKPDGIGGGHRHTLEDSDRVKKSSVQRYLLKESKNKKNNPVRISYVFDTYSPYFLETPNALHLSGV